MIWTGKALAEDLQDNLIRSGQMAWVEMPLGSSTRSTAIGRGDVVAATMSYNMRVTVYEVKVSAPDFQRDVKAGKYLTYFKNANLVYFACPARLIQREDLPPRVGLIWRHENQWRTQKAAAVNKTERSLELVMALLMRTWRQKMTPRQVEEYKSLKQASRAYGKKFALDIARGMEMMEGMEQQRRRLVKLLGYSEATDFESVMWGLNSKVERLLTQRLFAQSAVKLVGLVESLFQGTPMRAKGVARDLRQIAHEVEEELKEVPWSVE